MTRLTILVLLGISLLGCLQRPKITLCDLRSKEDPIHGRCQNPEGVQFDKPVIDMDKNICVDLQDFAKLRQYVLDLEKENAALQNQLAHCK